MEFALLAKVGAIINWVVKGGYSIAGIYIARTGVKYYQDYKHFSEQDKAEVK